MHIQDFTSGAALSTENKQTINNTFGKEVVWKEGIATFSLDCISENIDIQPDLIKIDVDGNENKILNGGGKVFSNKKLRSIIIEMIEYLPNYSSIKKQLIDYGFKLEKKYDESQIWSR